MRNLIAIPLLLFAVILQSAVISEIRLLSGYADLLLVMLAAWALQDRVDSGWHWAIVVCLLAGFVSGMPWPILTIGYLGVIFIARVLQRRVWQLPLLTMFSVVFMGTLFQHILNFVGLRVLGTPFAFGDILGLITLPSLLLNMLISIPLYPFMRDLSHWVYPVEEYA